MAVFEIRKPPDPRERTDHRNERHAKMNPPFTLTVNHRYVTNYGREIEVVSRVRSTRKTRCGQTFRVSRKLSVDGCEVAVGPVAVITVKSTSVIPDECA